MKDELERSLIVIDSLFYYQSTLGSDVERSDQLLRHHATSNIE